MSMRISEEIDGRLRVETPYDEDFIKRLKSTVPYNGREWVKHLKAWIVDRVYLEDVKKIGIDIWGQPAVKVEIGVSLAEVYAVLYLTPDAPFWLVKKVRDFLAVKEHPDIGGSHERMVAINSAYEQIKKMEGA